MCQFDLSKTYYELGKQIYLKNSQGDSMSKINNQSQVTSTYTLPDTSTKTSNVTSNVSSTEYMTTSFTKVRSTAKNFGESGDEIEQTLVLTNSSEYQIFNVSIKENISPSAEFKAGSVTIDGASQPTFDIVTGFELPDAIEANGEVTIKFVVTIKDTTASDIVNMNSTITYSVNEIQDLVENSNVVNINLTSNVITIKKTSNKTAVIKGDQLIFQNVIKNEGNATNTDVTFKDDIPEGTSFVAGSVKIDNMAKEDADPAVGIKLDDLAPNAEITVVFEVTVN